MSRDTRGGGAAGRVARGAARRAAAAGSALAALALAACGGGAPPAAPVRVSVDAGGLSAEIATGAPTARGEVLTVAHVLDGARGVRVAGNRARVVRVDRRRDLAWLAADVAPGRFSDGLHVIRDGKPATIPARVIRRVNVTLDGGARRAALELDAEIEPGDSGAPLTQDGHIVGVVFARGRSSAWAVALSGADVTMEEVATAR